MALNMDIIANCEWLNRVQKCMKNQKIRKTYD